MVLALIFENNIKKPRARKPRRGGVGGREAPGKKSDLAGSCPAQNAGPIRNQTPDMYDIYFLRTVCTPSSTNRQFSKSALFLGPGARGAPRTTHFSNRSQGNGRGGPCTERRAPPAHRTRSGRAVPSPAEAIRSPKVSPRTQRSFSDAA